MTQAPVATLPLGPAGPRATAEPPAAIGRYMVLGLVGRGAMGDVYAAYDPQLNRKVAIKVLRSSGAGAGVGGAADDSEATEGRRRMMREAQAIAKVSHPNVIVVHDVGAFEDQVFVAMEFVEGHTLAYWLLAETRAWPDILKLFAEAGRGLAAAHQKSLVHRDFKPENVIIGADGQVRVMDFGLARTVRGPRRESPLPVPDAADAPEPFTPELASVDLNSTRILSTPGNSPPEYFPGAASSGTGLEISHNGAIVGTPAYMAPEQFLGQDTDARTDQFSFCVALYEALYGERPFRGRTVLELQAAVLRGEVNEPAAKKGVPPGLRKVLLRGLKVNPQERWPSMKALLAAVEDNRLFAGRRRLASGAAAKLSGVWEAAVRGRPVKSAAKEAMRAAFLATGKPYAAAAFDNASRILDRYAKSWSDMYVDICEATHVRGEQSPEVMDLRMACLLECLESLRALSRIFRTANGEVVENAVTAASALGGLERCADVNLLRARVRPPEDHDTRLLVDRLRARLAEIRMLGQVGRYGDGLEAIAAVEEEVRRVDYGPLLAETLLEKGRLHAERRDRDAAPRLLEEAVWAAELCRHEEVAAEAATALVYFGGYPQRSWQVTELWARYAETILRRMGGHDILWGWLLNNRSAMHEKQGRFAEAVQDARGAVAAKERAGCVNNAEIALSLNNLGIALVRLGEIDEAALHLERAVTILEEDLGEDHPNTALSSSNYAEILNALGRFGQARDMAARALAIFERALAPDGSVLAFPLVALGIACLGQGASADALPMLERAAAIRDATEDDPALLGEVHFALARALAISGKDPGRASTLAEQARAEYERATSTPAAARELAKIAAWLASDLAPAADG